MVTRENFDRLAVDFATELVGRHLGGLDRPVACSRLIHA